MKNKVTLSALMFFLVTLLGCPNRPVTPVPPVVDDQAACPGACANLRRLGCEEGEPIVFKKACSSDAECGGGLTCSAGSCQASCEKFCVDTENKGVWLDPVCVSQISSCSQVESCPGSK